MKTYYIVVSQWSSGTLYDYGGFDRVSATRLCRVMRGSSHCRGAIIVGITPKTKLQSPFAVHEWMVKQNAPYIANILGGAGCL